MQSSPSSLLTSLIDRALVRSLVSVSSLVSCIARAINKANSFYMILHVCSRIRREAVHTFELFLEDPDVPSKSTTLGLLSIAAPDACI